MMPYLLDGGPIIVIFFEFCDDRRINASDY